MSFVIFCLWYLFYILFAVANFTFKTNQVKNVYCAVSLFLTSNFLLPNYYQLILFHPWDSFKRLWSSQVCILDSSYSRKENGKRRKKSLALFTYFYIIINKRLKVFFSFLCFKILFCEKTFQYRFFCFKWNQLFTAEVARPVVWRFFWDTWCSSLKPRV